MINICFNTKTILCNKHNHANLRSIIPQPWDNFRNINDLFYTRLINGNAVLILFICFNDGLPCQFTFFPQGVQHTIHWKVCWSSYSGFNVAVNLEYLECDAFQIIILFNRFNIQHASLLKLLLYHIQYYVFHT